MNRRYNGNGVLGYPNGLVGCASMNDDAGAGGCGDGIYWGGSRNADGYSGGASYNANGVNGAGGNCSTYVGTGGGSYATGSNITITGAVGTGHGSVTITKYKR